MPHRRRFLSTLAAFPLGAGVSAAFSQQRRPQKEYLRVGVATSLSDSGFAHHIRTAVAHSTGMAIEIVAGPSGQVLNSLEAGEIDIGITHAPDIELALERQGLVHDRRFVASNDFLIAGPVERPAPVKGRKKPPPPKDPLGLLGGQDAVAALAQVAAAGQQAAAQFVAPVDRSGAWFKQAALWKAAGVSPQGAWYLESAGGMGETLAQANARGAYVLVDRGTWTAARQRGGLAVVVEGDERLVDSYHAMRSFRANHPAGKLFMDWLTGPLGRRAVAGAPGGYRTTPVA